jgi:hypothetical protein
MTPRVGRVTAALVSQVDAITITTKLPMTNGQQARRDKVVIRINALCVSLKSPIITTRRSETEFANASQIANGKHRNLSTTSRKPI